MNKEKYKTIQVLSEKLKAHPDYYYIKTYKNSLEFKSRKVGIKTQFSLDHNTNNEIVFGVVIRNGGFQLSGINVEDFSLKWLEGNINRWFNNKIV